MSYNTNVLTFEASMCETAPYKPKPSRVRDVVHELELLSHELHPSHYAADELLIRLVEVLAVYMDHAGNNTNGIYRCLILYRNLREKEEYE